MKTLRRAWAAWLALPEVARIALVIALMGGLLLPLKARADLVSRNGANELRLLASACSAPEVLAEVGPTLGAKMKEAHARVDGVEFKACWIEYRGGVFVIYDDGDRTQLPLRAFKEQPSA
jgi:hypothetical protein